MSISFFSPGTRRGTHNTAVLAPPRVESCGLVLNHDLSDDVDLSSTISDFVLSFLHDVNIAAAAELGG